MNFFTKAAAALASLGATQPAIALDAPVTAVVRQEHAEQEAERVSPVRPAWEQLKALYMAGYSGEYATMVGARQWVIDMFANERLNKRERRLVERILARMKAKEMEERQYA